MNSSFIALAILGGALVSESHATENTQIGDLILAFREKDNSVAINLEIDLGPASNFLALAPGTSLNLNYGGGYFATAGGLSAQDLRNVYGIGGTDNSEWNADSNLTFNVFGTTGAAGGNTLYLTGPEGSDLPRSTSSGQQGTAGRINTVSGSLNGSASLVSPTAGSVSSSLGGSYSVQYRGGNPGGLTKDWNQFGLVLETNVVSSGTADASLFVLTAGSGPGTEVGRFSLDSAGNLSYLAVPEPGSFALLLSVGAMFAGFRRSRRVA